MGIFLIILTLLVVTTIVKNLVHKPKINWETDYLSPPVCQSIKGFFVILIFFSHFNAYISTNNPIDLPLISFCKFFGQLIVVPFFLYSGYGIYESIKKKGSGYINAFPKKRILKTLLHFDLALILFLILNQFLGIHYSIKTFLLSLIAWEDIGNSNWFIFAILATYLFTYIAFKISKNHFRSITIIFLLTAVFIVALYVLKKEEPWWYNTIICYPIGILYSYSKEHIEKLFFKPSKIFLPLSICILACFAVCSIYDHILPTITFQIRAIFFSVLLIIWARLFPFTNSALKWFGGYVFEIYILQRIPMTFFKAQGLNDSLYLYLAICIFATFLLSVAFKKITTYLDSKFIA